MQTLLFQGHCILDGVVVVVAIGVVVVVVGCFGAGPRRFRARLVSWGKPRTYPTAGAEAESVLGAPRASPEALGPLGPSGRASWESGWLRHAMHVQTGLPKAPPPTAVGATLGPTGGRRQSLAVSYWPRGSLATYGGEGSLGVEGVGGWRPS